MDAKELGNQTATVWRETTEIGPFGHVQSMVREGLTKREYFAGLAMQGVLSSGLVHAPVDVAKDAVTFADALLAELSKESP